ncbi:CYTH domain-containing protein [Prosthecobacter sp.]|uniref:CYTH domain-containing protein n=1 Tax=Prosthecobacter sp. TaxID=1965333 RepID=UPI001DF86AA2|nr:CYTH domain-containing protein [Prosthecobacter sp.]MCB1279741.1 CYTH domain-containing protein [Prosthecobacter sp.]
MATEIERKYLLKPGAWRPESEGRRLTQGYLSRDPDRTVRVRIAGEGAFMTVKSRRTGISRTEIEFPITLEQARDLMALCFQPVIDKTRHEVMHDGMLWEVDVFHGANDGLIVAEIELPAEDTPFTLPEWIGEEVSHDLRYTNSRLSAEPFTTW